MRRNVYLRGFEIGNENFSSGISYYELKNQFLKEGFKITDNFEEYFINWFFENFYERYQFPYYHGIRYGNNFRKLTDFTEESKKRPCILSSKAFFDLVDYQELIETKKSSKQANRNSLIAILLTLIAIIISIFTK